MRRLGTWRGSRSGRGPSVAWRRVPASATTKTADVGLRANVGAAERQSVSLGGAAGVRPALTTMVGGQPSRQTAERGAPSQWPGWSNRGDHSVVSGSVGLGDRGPRGARTRAGIPVARFGVRTLRRTGSTAPLAGDRLADGHVYHSSAAPPLAVRRARVLSCRSGLSYFAARSYLLQGIFLFRAGHQWTRSAKGC